MLQNEKLNCWEIKQCGREAGGAKVSELGECPASTENRLHGIHGGKNAGRTCWVVAGSLCDGKVQGTYVDKYNNCTMCEFYMKVKSEESADFNMTSSLLLKLES
jgi:hypothetical protein